LFCDHCGARNRHPARFCRICGDALWLPDAETLHAQTQAETSGGSPDAAAPLRLGDRYEVLGEIGRGGMGVVYALHDPVLDRFVAAKVIRPEVSNDPILVERFLREARIVAQLRHPNIVAIHDVGRGDSGHFYVMDYIDGRNLAELIEKRGSLPLADARMIILATSRAVAFAHDRGVLHRDLKPENVMLDDNGNVFVLDFGLARAAADPRLTRSGDLLGSPWYMSPEQLSGAEIDARSDVFAVGLLFYYLLAGAALFDGATLGEVRAQHAAWVIDPRLRDLGVPASVVGILESMLARNPADRLPDLRLGARFSDFSEVS
jgi:serine/threonine-protein kinase